jgi:hypothetical protein
MDLTLTVTAALTLDGTSDQFTFQSDSQSGTLAGDLSVVASKDDASPIDETTSDTASTSSSGDSSPTATASTCADSNIATNTQAVTDDLQAGTDIQTVAASPAAPNITGGDTFVFAANFGNATIPNFHPDTDVIEIDHTVFADFQALLAATQDDGYGNAITADPNDTITLKNVTVSQLIQHQGDFHFT